MIIYCYLCIKDNKYCAAETTLKGTALCYSCARKTNSEFMGR